MGRVLARSVGVALLACALYFVLWLIAPSLGLIPTTRQLLETQRRFELEGGALSAIALSNIGDWVSLALLPALSGLFLGFLRQRSFAEAVSRSALSAFAMALFIVFVLETGKPGEIELWFGILAAFVLQLLVAKRRLRPGPL